MIHIHRFLNKSSGGGIAAVAIAMLTRERLLAFTEEYAVRGRAMEGILHVLGVSAHSLSDVGGCSQPADQPRSAAERLSGRVFIGATECTSCCSSTEMRLHAPNHASERRASVFFLRGLVMNRSIFGCGLEAHGSMGRMSRT